MRVLRPLEVGAAEAIVQPFAKAAFDRAEIGSEVVDAMDQDRRARKAILNVGIDARILRPIGIENRLTFTNNARR
ncbi:hypothetical protein WK53_03495 [Burkholderia ubonensis]|uniref:Uncharacterized protein n=1 Tax=Burkholderia ubonensis TaxID=101571 RepID=A0AAW3NB46_9BURK|nr:hypothetical protein WK53_03495 [Burkholderia ubonensis]